MTRRQVAGAAVNARRVEVVEYVGDPASEGRSAALIGGIRARVNGFYGSVIGLDQADPYLTYSGRAMAAQAFRGAMSAGGVFSVYAASQDATLETGLPETTADPVEAALVAKLARRGKGQP